MQISWLRGNNGLGNLDSIAANSVMSQRKYDQACPVADFLDRFEGRWTLLIIRDLLIRPMRFKELLAGMPGIGTNLLANRLRDLAGEGIVEKKRDDDRVMFYVLTAKGRALKPVLQQMARWTVQHDSTRT